MTEKEQLFVFYLKEEHHTFFQTGLIRRGNQTDGTTMLFLSVAGTYTILAFLEEVIGSPMLIGERDGGMVATL